MTEGRRARYGWESSFRAFERASPRVVRTRLLDLIPDASAEQVRAWDHSIPQLQTEVREVVEAEPDADRYTAILEYELPLEARRPDVILLVRGAVVVLELKGKSAATQADIDQAAAYARDLRCYHRHCTGQDVHAVLVPTSARGYLEVRSGVHVAGPDALDSLVRRLQPPWPTDIIEAEAFLSADAYCPLPTIVRAARELFEHGELRNIRRARASTDPAVEDIRRIVMEAARTRTRRLVLVTGVPGAGKTLVGLRAVHAHFLDDLIVDRAGRAPTAPAVFLASGLERFSTGRALRRGSSPKLILWNNALVTGLGLTGFEEAREDRALWGRLVENAVGAHLLNNLQGAPYEVTYWRDGRSRWTSSCVPARRSGQSR